MKRSNCHFFVLIIMCFLNVKEAYSQKNVIYEDVIRVDNAIESKKLNIDYVRRGLDVRYLTDLFNELQVKELLQDNINAAINGPGEENVISFLNRNYRLLEDNRGEGVAMNIYNKTFGLESFIYSISGYMINYRGFSYLYANDINVNERFRFPRGINAYDGILMDSSIIYRGLLYLDCDQLNKVKEPYDCGRRDQLIKKFQEVPKSFVDRGKPSRLQIQLDSLNKELYDLKRSNGRLTKIQELETEVENAKMKFNEEIKTRANEHFENEWESYKVIIDGNLIVTDRNANEPYFKFINWSIRE